MNRSRRVLVFVVAVVAVLTAVSALAWDSVASPAAQPGLAAAPAPLGNPAASPASPQSVEGGPGFVMVSAYQFRPRYSDTDWAYDDLDLYNASGGFGAYDASFTLPDKVTVTGMTVYYYDNSNSDSIFFLWRRDPLSRSYQVMAEVSTSGAVDGYRADSDTSIEAPVVDQQTYTYLMTIHMYGSGTEMRVSGVRVDYGYAENLPLVVKDK